MQSKIFASIIISLLLMTTILAQEPPSWINLGDLPWGADKVFDILEVPGTNILIAGCNYEIAMSSNGGQSWSNVFTGAGGREYVQLDRDSITGRIWAVEKSPYNDAKLYYSADTGKTWGSVSGPPSSPVVNGNTIEIIGDYVYYGPSIANPYKICLYRLHQTTLQWELVLQYQQCNAITRMKYHNGKLMVFARDAAQNLIRVFSYTPTDLDKRAIPIGKAETAKVTNVEK